MDIRGHKIRHAPGDVYLIAEIGINHGGSMQRATQMICDCADAGAHAVKFQGHDAEAEMVPGHPWRETIERTQLSPSEIWTLCDRAHKRGLAAIVTPFTAGWIDELEYIRPDAVKIGSGEAGLKGFAEHCNHVAVRLGVPLIASSGCGDACPWADVQLSCVSEYPAPPVTREIFNLPLTAMVPWIRGYSDHTACLHCVGQAIAWGSRVVEVHVCEPGIPDQPDLTSSFPIADLRRIRAGDFPSECSASGRSTKDVGAMVRGLTARVPVSTRELLPGYIVSPSDVRWLRSHVHAAHAPDPVGLRVRERIPPHTTLERAHVAVVE